MAVYEIELIRALFEDRLNDPSITIKSFYEQIEDPDAIDRYLKEIKEMIDLQNREGGLSNFKAMGIISQVGDAEIVNITRNFVVPMNYQVRLDIDLQDRDYVLGKIKTLIDNLRGRKFDLVQVQNGNIYIPVQPTISTSNDKMNLANNVLIGSTNQLAPNGSTEKTAVINDILNRFNVVVGTTYTIYQINSPVGGVFQLLQRTFLRTDIGGGSFVNTLSDVTNLGSITGRFKVSLSFNGVQSQEPYLSNGDDRVFLFFSGNATITDHRVTLGNDIILTTLQEGKNTGTITIVEPTEVPASLAIDDDSFSTWAMGHRTIDRNMKIGNRLSYTFVYDNSITLYNNLYRYARFGAGASTFTNLIFTIKEYRYSFGVLTLDTYFAKLAEASTQNTNGDVMMIMVSMKAGDY
jgi:hypothetical protein